MKQYKIYLPLLFVFFSKIAICQELIFENLYPDPEQSWPALYDVKIDDQGRIWTCSEKGDVYFMEDDDWVHVGEFGDDVSFNEIGFDSLGNTWLSSNNGLYKYDGTDWTNLNSQNAGLPTDYTGNLTIDQNDLIWFSAGGEGVITFDGDHTFHHYTTNNSALESNSVDDIEMDNNGNIWIADDELIVKISGDVWMNYDAEDELEWGVWVRSMFPGEGDQMYFCTWSGLFSYDGTWHSHTDISGYNELSGGVMDSLGNIWYCELFNGMYFWDGTELRFLKKQKTHLFQASYFQLQSMMITKNYGLETLAPLLLLWMIQNLQVLLFQSMNIL